MIIKEYHKINYAIKNQSINMIIQKSLEFYLSN
jgi:hypothetical protein